MIELHQVSKSYDNSIAALIDINLKINKGDFVFITGPSGAGKTTILKLLSSAEKPTKGEVIVNGLNITRIRPSAVPYFRRQLGVVFQDFKLIARKTVYENVALSLQILGNRRKSIKKRVWQVLKWVGLLQKKDAFPPQLSGGEQQRVAIARAIINNPVILLADEPTGNLDAALALDIMKLLRAINARGTTIVIATHNRSIAESFSDIIVMLEHGQVKHQPPEPRTVETNL